MTVQTETMPDWETRIFAEIHLEMSEKSATVAQREHETATAAYFTALASKDENKIATTRRKFSRTMNRAQATRRNLASARTENDKLTVITVAQ